MKNISKKIIYLSFFILGIISILIQMILIRELVTSFFGNELFTSFVLASWLLSCGVGSIIFKKLITRKKILLWLQIITPLLLFFSLILSRLGKIILGGNISLPDLFWVILFSFFIISLVGVLLGLQFAVLVRRLICIQNDNNYLAINYGYIIECIGFFIGALLFSFHLFNYSSFVVLYFLFVLYIILFLLFLFFDFLQQKRKIFITLVLILFLLLIIGFKQIIILDYHLNKLNFPKQTILTSTNSKYGVIQITENQGQLNFYYSGQLSTIWPDRYNNELLADLPMLISKKNENILIIGNGFTGLINELNKYHPEKITYLELDENYYNEASFYLKNYLINRYENIEIIFQDARKFLNQTEGKFDLIIINHPNPTTVAENRYFTKEFLTLIKSKLNQEGMAEIKINSTQNYTSSVQNQFLVIIFHTINSVFPTVFALPDNEIIFLASSNKIRFNFNEIKEKYLNNKLLEKYITPDYLNWRFNSKNTKDLNNQLAISQVKINYDLKPILFFEQLKIFSQELSSRKLSFWLITFITFFIIVVFTFFKKTNNYSLILISLIPEFCLIAFEVIIILLFQIMHGILYTQISFIFSIILLSIALGSLLFSYLIKKFNKYFLLKLVYLLIFLSFAISLFLILFYQSIFYFQFIFYFLSALAGLAIGSKFPIINRIYLINNSNPTIIYGMDLLGGSIGAISAALFMLPLFGVTGCLIIIQFFCLIALLMSIYCIKNKY